MKQVIGNFYVYLDLLLEEEFSQVLIKKNLNLNKKFLVTQILKIFSLWTRLLGPYIYYV